MAVLDETSRNPNSAGTLTYGVEGSPPGMVLDSAGNISFLGTITTATGLVSRVTGVDYTGVLDSTSALTSALSVAGYGGRVDLGPGIIKYSNIVINHAQILSGSGWHCLRDLVENFGDSGYQNATYFGGTVMRSTATSGSSIAHLGSGGNNVMSGGLRDMIIIGPGSGTSVGIQIGSPAVPVVKPVYQNVMVCNFLTGCTMDNVNEAGIYDLTIRGCVDGLLMANGINANGFYNLNLQRCTNGFSFTDATSLGNTFVSPIFQNVSVGGVIRGESCVLLTPYFEIVPTILQYIQASHCRLVSPSVQGAGIKNLTIASGCFFNEFYGMKTNAAAFTVTNSGYGTLFSGVIAGYTESGSQSVIFDLNNALLRIPRLTLSGGGVNPDIDSGSATGYALHFSTTNAQIRSTTSDPEGSVTSPPGSAHFRSDGTARIKESGSGNTGWRKVLTSTGISVLEGSNGRQGVATLVGGTVVVANTSVTATSRILLTVQSLGTVAIPAPIAVTARTAGTSFTITSAAATDTSVVAYEIFEPA